ncbi:MAG UNVERIFIED_CONTAM: hypothetical protein LVR29_08070 [Microcystis novacekii LVE1205-3]
MASSPLSVAPVRWNGQFNRPYGIAVGSGGNIYVADTLNSRVQVFNSSGVFQSTFGTGTVIRVCPKVLPSVAVVISM